MDRLENGDIIVITAEDEEKDIIKRNKEIERLKKEKEWLIRKIMPEIALKLYEKEGHTHTKEKIMKIIIKEMQQALKVE